MSTRQAYKTELVDDNELYVLRRFIYVPIYIHRKHRE